jgi:hypothetical protein
VFNFAEQHGNQLVPDDLGLPHGSPDEVTTSSPSGDLDDARSGMTVVEHGYTTEDSRKGYPWPNASATRALVKVSSPGPV